MRNWKALSALFLGCSALLVGCKSAPELTSTQALALVQAKYDQTAPVGVNVLVNDPGMLSGAKAKLWDRTKIYPNKIWADFKLTADGKKAVVLPGGGDVIEWRPQSADDKNYTIVVTTVAANRLKAKDMGELSDEAMAGAEAAKSGKYAEVVNLTGVPEVLQDIAHNPGNKLSVRKEADFALVNGAWTLKTIR
ncbi:hypothetical protein P8935_06455 [Telmatobacter sp. DSM 110680]|uniref:Uncharacterized protein n=1 Tax=Telmatobacter sp. DSM 110680 TaxID=3036704 RepID=A0AAU7DMC6_9BACT